MDEFREEQQRQLPGNAISWYERVRPSLTEDRGDALDAALRDPAISARAIAAVLERWGHPVKEGTISAWRRARVPR